MHGCKWIGNLKQEPYDEIISYKDALNYRFTQDLDKYIGDGVSPIQEFTSGSKDCLPYLIIMNHITNGFIFKEYDKKHADNILWENLKGTLVDYSPFT